jgi:hypothetical protein
MLPQPIGLGVAEATVGADRAGDRVADRHASAHLGDHCSLVLADDGDGAALVARMLRTQIGDPGSGMLRAEGRQRQPGGVACLQNVGAASHWWLLWRMPIASRDGTCP